MIPVKTEALGSKLSGKLVNSLCSLSVWLSPAAPPSASSPSPLSSGPLNHRRYDTQRGSCIDYTAVTRPGMKKKVNKHAWKPNTRGAAGEREQHGFPINTTKLNFKNLSRVGMATASVVTCSKTCCHRNKAR